MKEFDFSHAPGHMPLSALRDHLLYEAREMRRLIQPELIEPGYMHEGRWRHIANTYARFGMLPTDYPLDEFLYPRHGEEDLSWLYWLAAGGFALAAVVGGIGQPRAVLRSPGTRRGRSEP